MNRYVTKEDIQMAKKKKKKKRKDNIISHWGNANRTTIKYHCCPLEGLE